ncbi:MAG: hypothetical protein ACP5VS_19000, partial [Desulfomonilaceae bacterium]
MNIQLAMAKGEDLDATEHKAVRFEERSDTPGLSAVNDSAAIQDDGESEGGEEEGHGSEAGGAAGQGGFDRLWDVATNG